MKWSPVSSSANRRWSLVLLCAVQSCERFAFLAMLPLFVPYAQERHGIAAPQALFILALFQALAYLGGLPGGWLADRAIGTRKATVLGACLLACGYGLLALDRASLLWPALLMMVLGQSAFRPGLHVLLARVADADDHVRERVFLWHYLAANLGYAAGALFSEWAHARVGWRLLFLGAAGASAMSVVLLVARLPWLRAQAIRALDESAHNSRSPGAASMKAVWLLSGVAVIFWLTAQQAGSSLTVFAAMNTLQRVTLLGQTIQIGPGHFASLHGLIVLAMLPILLALQGRKIRRAPSTIDLMIWGYVATAGAFALMALAGLRGGDLGRVSSVWLVCCYLLLSLAEVLLAPLGMSLLTRLAPKHKAAQVVGLWFSGSAIGNGLAGMLGLCWDRWPHHRYFAALAVLSLAAAAGLLSRRRYLDWLTALNTSAASPPVVEKRTQTMTPTSKPNRKPIAQPLSATVSDQPASWTRVLLMALPIFLPGALMANTALSLLLRGVSAIVCGLAVLLCGPYLFTQSLMQWARRGIAHPN
ncbi:MAG: MFS transporter [Myxococcales bacterium]|nr:MFS transporter [Myxococcales bacterium]